MTIWDDTSFVPNPELDNQLFLDSMQVQDVIRLQGEIKQQQSSTHIQQLAEQLGHRITEHARTHREMLKLVQVNGVNGDGVPSVEVIVR